MTKPRPPLLRRLTLSVLMPLFLLLSQQGAMLHELSHWHVASASTGQGFQAADADDDFCLTCLAYAQVGGLAKSEKLVVPAPASLGYHFAPAPVQHVAEAARPAARNRGPPPAA